MNGRHRFCRAAVDRVSTHVDLSRSCLLDVSTGGRGRGMAYADIRWRTGRNRASLARVTVREGARAVERVRSTRVAKHKATDVGGGFLMGRFFTCRRRASEGGTHDGSSLCLP
jgi:hypothetical protein